MRPPSFLASPADALAAPHEEFLYLACLREGTGVKAPDFLAVVDAEDGRVVHETPMPNVGDEVHDFGWNRCSSACHGPDRSHLIVRVTWAKMSCCWRRRAARAPLRRCSRSPEPAPAS